MLSGSADRSTLSQYDTIPGSSDYVFGRQKEKRTLPRATVAVSGFVYVAVLLIFFRPNSGSGILTPIPFRHNGDDLNKGSSTPSRHPRRQRKEEKEPIVAFHEVNLCLRID